MKKIQPFKVGDDYIEYMDRVEKQMKEKELLKIQTIKGIVNCSYSLPDESLLDQCGGNLETFERVKKLALEKKLIFKHLPIYESSIEPIHPITGRPLYCSNCGNKL